MTIVVALAVVSIAILLLSTERIPIEVSSLAIVVLLVASGLATTEQAFAGFSSETAIFIFALLALTQGLGATGVMQLVGRRMLVFARLGPTVFIAMMLVAVCGFSAVASNTAVTAAFLPVAIASSAQARVPASQLLMPMAFASMLGGTVTLFGTSTNLVVSAAMEEQCLARIGFVELARVGLPLAVIGVVATLFIARRLLRGRGAGGEDDGSLVQRAYLTEAMLPPQSRLLGRPLRHLTEELGVPVRAVMREGQLLEPDSDEPLTADDHLVISGSLDDILKVKDLRSLGLRPDLRYADLQGRHFRLVELSIPPTSNFIGKSVRALRLADRHGLLVLAIHRHPSLEGPRSFEEELSAGAPVRDVPLAAGDVLLVSGPERRLRALAREEDVTVLGTVDYERPRYGRALVAVAIFAATVLAAGFRLVSPAVAGVTGMLAMMATGCVHPRTAFRVDWRVVIMIGALLALGGAMERSGAGEFLAQAVLPVAGVAGPRGLLFVLMLATILLSIPMSNQAAALLMLPVGVHAALDLGLDPRAFAMGICLAASCSFMTPLEPSAALVYGPGRYRFSDFLRVGGPVTALMLLLLTVAVPVAWPLRHG